MSILVVGSVAFDTVRTPAGEGRDLLGGSATHFSVAASFFAPVRLVAVVGEDFDAEHLAPFRERGIDLAGLERLPGRTFRWAGEYAEDLNDRRTLDTQLNVFADFEPRLPSGWAETPVVFLANIDPELQERVLDQVGRPRIVAADTMNFWIASKLEALRRTLGRVGILFINDAEARQLTGKSNVVRAAASIRALGPEVVVVKRGEHGAVVFDRDDVFAVPAYPLREVVDPTGAGDAFAGGFLGYLASRLDRGEPDYRRAAVVGSVMASFQVEAFSLERLRRLRPADIRERYEGFQRLTRFGGLEGEWSVPPGGAGSVP
jgi:sugar/nucleoside kinase (ribokinase family)